MEGVEDITFDADANILVIEADPVILWLIDSLGLGETAELTYTVDGQVDETELAEDTVNFFSTAGVGTVEPILISAGEEGDDLIGADYLTPAVIGVIVLVVVIGVISFLKGRGGSPPTQRKKPVEVIKKKEDKGVKVEVEIKMGKKKIMEEDLEEDMEN